MIQLANHASVTVADVAMQSKLAACKGKSFGDVKDAAGLVQGRLNVGGKSVIMIAATRR